MVGRAGARVLVAVCLSLLGLAAPRSAAAQEWFDDYGRGVEALRRGRPAAAVPLLQSAARKRAEPGQNILTYGTNRLAAYHPYLHLADALIRLQRFDEAQAALSTSERYGREPVAERQALSARLAQLRAPREAPPPTAPEARSTPEPVPYVPPPTTMAAVVAPPPPATPAAATPSPRMSPRATATPVPPSPSPVQTPPPVATADPSPGGIIVFSDPPGASVYLDDEPIGATDPASGRRGK
jgi:hypothetical protein